MIGVNKVILIGNLGKDPEIISFDDVKKASFSLATTETHKTKDGTKIEETEWHNIICWRGLAEVAEKFLKKGTHLYVEGRIKSRMREDKDGNKKRVVEIVADDSLERTAGVFLPAYYRKILVRVSVSLVVYITVGFKCPYHC